MRIATILVAVLGISVGLLADSATAEDSPAPACSDVASCQGTDDPPPVPDDEPPPADTGLIDDSEEAPVYDDSPPETTESGPPPQPVNPDPPPKGPEPAPQPAPAPAPEQPPAAQPTAAVPTTVVAAVPAQPQAPPDICVNYPGMKTVPDEWTRSNDGVCSPPPPRGGYCDPKTGKFYDLARGQDKSEPYASMNLVDAYADPVSGSISCDFPKPQEEATPITTQSMKTASTQPVPSPPKVITPAETKPIPPPPRASPGPVASPSPAQPAQKSRSIAPPPSAPPAP